MKARKIKDSIYWMGSVELSGLAATIAAKHKETGLA